QNLLDIVGRYFVLGHELDQSLPGCEVRRSGGIALEDQLAETKLVIPRRQELRSRVLEAHAAIEKPVTTFEDILRRIVTYLSHQDSRHSVPGAHATANERLRHVLVLAVMRGDTASHHGAQAQSDLHFVRRQPKRYSGCCCCSHGVARVDLTVG